MTANRRQFSRVRFHAVATLTFSDDAFPVDVVDISLKGALVKPAEPHFIQIGTTGKLTVQLDQADDYITMEVAVVHHENVFYGLACCEIDLDSMTHLRRLIELNLGDETLLERQVGRLGKPN